VERYVYLQTVVSVRAWNQDMYPSGAICIPTDGCFSEGLESGYVPEWSDMYTYRRLFQWGLGIRIIYPSGAIYMYTYRRLFQWGFGIRICTRVELYVYLQTVVSVRAWNRDNVPEWSDMYTYRRCFSELEQELSNKSSWYIPKRTSL
jgi:hypothetical protein